MPENIEAWWARRQRSKGREVPYEIGAYRSDWERYPVLIRQYHPDLNRNITLTQIPPAAEVYLTWQCDMGHVFVATPEEQRNRPGPIRRRSSWCPDCLALAAPKRVVARPRAPAPALAPAPPAPASPPASAPPASPPASAPPASPPPSAAPAPAPPAPAAAFAPPAPASHAHPLATREPATARATIASRSAAGAGAAPEPTIRRPAHAAAGVARSSRRVAGGAASAGPRAGGVATTLQNAVGEAFHSGRAPRPASAAEGELRMRLGERFDLDLKAANAVKVRRPFFTHREVWPDIVLAEFRVAIEYDTIGKFGLEHVGTREATDRRKDRLLREAGWEVIRVRVGKLQPLGEFDLVAGGVTSALVERIIDRLRDIRGDLFVNAYLR